MRRLATLTLVLVWLAVGGCALRKPAWERPPPAATDAPVVQAGSLHRGELDNGLEVMVLEDRRLPRVVLGVAVRRGAGIVATDQAGLAGFTASLMERGAGGRDALALAEAVDSLGAGLAVNGDWDSMMVSVSGLSRDLDTLLEILADVVLRPRFEAKEATKVRGETLAALEKAKDDPATLARWELARVLYDGHRYGRPLAGVSESISGLDTAAARSFHRRVFVSNDAIFFAAGDVSMDALFDRVGRNFGTWERGPRPEPGPPPPPITPESRRIVIVDRPDLGQARILLGHEGMTRTDSERVPIVLMNTVLGGGGFSARLMERLRSDEGLTYGVGSGFSPRRQTGPFVVSTFTRVPEVRRALDLTLEVLDETRTDPPDEQELRDAKALMTGRFSLGLETSSAVVQSLVNLDVYGLPEDSLDTYRGRVRAVTTDDVARMARERLHPERAAIVLVGPAEALLPQVEDLAPVEVVTP